LCIAYAEKARILFFSKFLSKESPRFLEKIGRNISPASPVGEPAERSSDIVDKGEERTEIHWLRGTAIHHENYVPY